MTDAPEAPWQTAAAAHQRQASPRHHTKIDLMNNEKRKTLLYSMASAKSEQEITRAQWEADLWLREHPEDTAIAAAKRTLDNKSEKLNNPERQANKAAWVTLMVAVPLAITASFTFSVSWGIAVVFGTYVGMQIALHVWEFVGVWAESRSKRKSAK